MTVYQGSVIVTTLIKMTSVDEPDLLIKQFRDDVEEAAENNNFIDNYVMDSFNVYIPNEGKTGHLHVPTILLPYFCMYSCSKKYLCTLE